MTDFSFSDLAASALNAMRDADCWPNDTKFTLIFDGQLRRFRVDGDKAGSKNGWAVFYGDGIPAGAFGSWKTGASETWCAKADHELTSAEKALRDQHLTQARAARHTLEQQVRAAAQKRALDLWDKSRDTVAADHPYLLHKQIPAIGLRQLQDMLVIPLCDTAGTLHSLQFISPDGSKHFLTGGAISGHFAVIGEPDTADTLLIVEGYATGVSVHLATNLPVLVAFNAGNLLPVARAWLKHRAAKLIFCADDDQWTDGNPGLTKARQAAALAQGLIVQPHFPTLDGQPTDFNDLHCRYGLNEVQTQLADPQPPPPCDPPRRPASPPPPYEPPPPPRDPPGGDGQGGEEWEQYLRRSGRNGEGDYLTSAGNMSMILQSHFAWAGLLAYDEMSYRTIKKRPPPYPGGAVGEWCDADDVWTAIWLEQHYNIRPRTTLVAQVVAATAQLNRFHQAREWLEGLPRWDGIERLPTFFQDCVGAALTPYSAAVGRAFFVAAVARVMRPGVKVDTMLVLEGKQGVGKSKLILELFSPSWHIEISYAPGSLDFFQSLRGCWCAEFGELSQFDRADTSRIKQVLTQVQDTYRASYGHHAGTYPRQVVFVGSTNKREWGFDETGMRRFLPIYCTDINVQYAADNRDQLWAEALQRYRKGETWWDIPDADKEQDARFDYDAWEELVSAWIEKNESYVLPGQPFTFGINKVYESAIHAENARNIPPITRADQTRLGRVLTRLGWQRKREMVGGRRAYVYERAPV